MRRLWLIAAQLLLLGAWWSAAAPSAQAQRGGPVPHLGRALTAPLEASPADWVFDLSLVSGLPLGWEAEGQLTAGSGFFVRASAGHTPSPYLGAVAGALGDAGVYRPRLRPVVDDLVSNGAWTVRAALGWTAFDGLELALGYALVAAETHMQPSSVSAALNTSIPWPSDMGDVPLTVRLHAVSARVGWRALLSDAITFRVALGWTHTFAVDAHLSVPEEMRELDGDPATTLESRLADGLREYGFAPELSVALGYRF